MRAAIAPARRVTRVAAAARIGGIVLGGDSQGLGIARSLGAHGVPVCVIDDEPSIARASRYVQHVVRVRDMRSERGLLDALEVARSRYGLPGWVLYPTRDENVAAIAAHRDALARHFRVPTPALETVRYVWDKRETYRLAAQLGIQVPRTWFPRAEADLDQVELGTPLVIKPAVKEHFFYATGVKAWRADSRADLLAAFRRAAAIVPAGEVIVQELIPGGTRQQYAYCAFFAGGQAAASMTVQRCRQHPSDFGRASTYVRTISLPELAEPATDLLRGIGYYGLAEVEFMRDPRDGAYRLLDVNARTWGYHTLGKRAGVDFPYLQFRHQTGKWPETAVPAQARPGVSWVRLITDVPNAVRDMRAGTLRTRGYLRSLLTADTEAVFSASDPLPGLYELALLPYLAVSRNLLGGLMFAASHPFAFFDYFRVPYDVSAGVADPSAAIGELWLADWNRLVSPRLYWLRTSGAGQAGRAGRYELQGFTFFGEVARDAAAPGLLGIGGRWAPVTPIRDSSGQRVAAIWEDGAGNIFLPFDPAEVMEQFWSERYLRTGRRGLATGGRAAALRGYYLARPAFPRPVQLWLRRTVAGLQKRPDFPHWPAETSLHDFYSWLFELIAGLAGEPVPYLDAWPDHLSWAMVLTHDVETAAGQQQVELLREPERALGLRSSWNFVGERYRVDPGLVRALQDEGCEVGVHGLRHDGRDLGSRRLMTKRLPAMREYAGQWSAVGFRSPGTQRRWDLMPVLGFDYDSSYSDTDPYEPQPGGCCSYLPYFNAGLVELPITMPQDHTLFAILAQPDAGIWASKARLLRERGGMALVVTHPDYAADRRVRDGYRALLDEYCDDPAAWHALPREVASWWRSRAESTVHRGSGRTVHGPAAGRATVLFATADRTEFWVRAG